MEKKAKSKSVGKAAPAGKAVGKSGSKSGGKSGSKSASKSVAASPAKGDEDTSVVNGKISVVGATAAKVASVLQKNSGSASRIESLDFTDNGLHSVPNIKAYTNLKTLVLDRNDIKDGVSLPVLPHLESLSVNTNELHDLASFIANVKKQCPKLRYLSILKNPCCPNFLVSGGKDMHDYQLYRYFVLHQLQTLKFLDFQAVNPQELADAKRKGQFMGVAKPRSSGGSAASESSTKMSAAVEDDVSVGAASSEHEARTYLGFNPYNYLGRESEGNRFIANNDL